MSNKAFQIKYVHPYRLIFLFPCSMIMILISTIFTFSTYNYLIASLITTLILGLIVAVLYWVGFARLIIKIDDSQISVDWNKKLPFDIKRKNIIGLKNITRLRIDNSNTSSQRAIKIYFKNGLNDREQSLYINSYDNKAFRGQINDLIEHLQDFGSAKGIPVFDHWDEFKQKGYFKYFNYFLILSLAVLLIILILVLMRK